MSCEGRCRLTEVREEVAHGQRLTEEGEAPHLAATLRAEEWEDLINPGEQERPG
jgi:hypothetical protein